MANSWYGTKVVIAASIGKTVPAARLGRPHQFIPLRSIGQISKLQTIKDNDETAALNAACE
jgi:hypothetical protein